MYTYVFKNKIRIISCIPFCAFLIFFTHFPVYLPSLFEYQNAALSYVDEADVIYLTYQFEFSEKTQVQI